MAVTNSAVFAAAMRATLRKQLLTNLRADLKWSDPRLIDEGEVDQGSDTIKFMIVPDLAVATTPLTEGTNPAAVALTLSTVSVSMAQYGNVLNYTDVAKVKSPLDLVGVAAERMRRNAQLTLDQIVRDSVATGGTPKYMGVGAPASRAAIAGTDLLRALDLRKLYGIMKSANVPFFSAGNYVLFMHPYVVYDLKTDVTAGGNWITLNQYSEAGRRELLSGEIGQLEGFRIVEVSNGPTVTSTTTVYETFAFGGIKPWGAGSLQTLTTEVAPPTASAYDPLALNGYMGWKCMYGVASLSDHYYYRVETGATSLA